MNLPETVNWMKYGVHMGKLISKLSSAYTSFLYFVLVSETTLVPLYLFSKIVLFAYLICVPIIITGIVGLYWAIKYGPSPFRSEKHIETLHKMGIDKVSKSELDISSGYQLLNPPEEKAIPLQIDHKDEGDLLTKISYSKKKIAKKTKRIRLK